MEKRLLTILILGFAFAALATTIIYRVPAGHTGVYYARLSGGTQLDTTYPVGWHAKFPWDEIYFYDHSSQRATDRFKPLTNRGETIAIEAQLVFRLRKDTIAFLHKSIGPDYVERSVKPEVAGRLRVLVGKYSKEELLEIGGAEIARLALQSDRESTGLTQDFRLAETGDKGWIILETLKIRMQLNEHE